MKIYLKYDGKEHEHNLPTDWSELDVVNAIGCLQALAKGLPVAKLQAEILSIILPVSTLVLAKLPDESFHTLMKLVEPLCKPPKSVLKCLPTIAVGDASYFVPLDLCSNFTTAQMATVDTFLKEEPFNAPKVCAAIAQTTLGDWSEFESKQLEPVMEQIQPWQALYMVSVAVFGFQQIGTLYPSKKGGGTGWLDFIFAITENGKFGNFTEVSKSNALAVIAFGDYLQKKQPA